MQLLKWLKSLMIIFSFKSSSKSKERSQTNSNTSSVLSITPELIEDKKSSIQKEISWFTRANNLLAEFNDPNMHIVYKSDPDDYFQVVDSRTGEILKDVDQIKKFEDRVTEIDRPVDHTYQVGVDAYKK